jgi:long-chain acyl-CoA synthetase
LVRRIHWTTTPITTLTPTLKVKRKETYNMFKKEIDALYALGEVKTAATPPSNANGKL